MKTLIVVLVLCVLACAHSCPKTTEITQEDIEAVKTVALVTVTNNRLKKYVLQYEMYYPVKPEPKRWKNFKTINLNKCDDVTLEPDDSYILGCKKENNDCVFVRRYDQLTTKEKSLLKL